MLKRACMIVVLIVYSSDSPDADVLFEIPGEIVIGDKARLPVLPSLLRFNPPERNSLH